MSTSLHAWLYWAAFAFAALGCTSVDPSATVLASCPDRAPFESVAPFLEAGCGTLDCHGALARPLRVYGKRGMRFDPSDLPGERPTTSDEVSASLRSFCSLTPEQMALVMSGDLTPDDLLAVGKARGEVHHKGDKVVTRGDDGDTCLTSWILGSVDAAACARAADLMVP